MVAEVEAKDKEIASLKADKADEKIIRDALTDKVKLLERLGELQDRDIERLKKASELDAQAIGKLQAQREQTREELEKTRTERDRARSLLRKIGGAALATGAAIGAALTYLLMRD